MASAIRWTRNFWPRLRKCPTPAGSRSVSTGWGCWRAERGGSSRWYGRHRQERRERDMSRTSLARQPERTLREPKELVAHGLARAADLADLERVAARYAVAVTPDIAALIDPDDPNDPIARQFIP